MAIASVPAVGMFTAVGVPIAVFALAAVVYVDARKVGMHHPPLWAGIVLVAGSTAAMVYVVFGVPAAGALVIAVGGLLVYVFERDDHFHGDEPADPYLIEGSELDERGGDGTDERDG